jgi:hypothetical protein
MVLLNLWGADMDARKLADAIEKSSHNGYNLDAAKMLRKQADEIEYWKEMFEKAMKEQEK